MGLQPVAIFVNYVYTIKRLLGIPLIFPRPAREPAQNNVCGINE